MKVKKLNYIYNNTGLFMIYVFVPSGSIYENFGSNKRRNIAGISHFLEHILFKHTEKYSGSEILRAFTEIGGYYNASTDKDETIFYVKTVMENYKIAIDILYDIVCKPVFRADEIATELKIVLEELSQTKDNMQDYIYEKTNMAIMPKENIYHNPVIGNKEDLKQITVSDVKQYFKERFGKVMILINCDVSSKHNVSNYMEDKFGTNKLLNFYDTSMQKLSMRFSPSIKIVSNDTYQYTTSLVFEAYKYAEVHKNIILSFLRFFLTDAGLYSILYLELREKRGLVYNVRMMNERFRYMGLMRLQFATSNKDTVSILQVVMEIFNRLKKDGLTPSELEFFKKSYLSSIGYKFTNEEYKTSWYGDNLFYGVEMSENAFTKEIANIKNKDIIHVCNEVFNFQKCGFFSLGTYDDTRKLNRKIKKLTNHISL